MSDGLGMKCPGQVDELQKKKNRNKSKVWATAEQVFHIIKRGFGFDKVRYLGLTKSHQTVHELRACNLYLHRKRLAVLG